MSFTNLSSPETQRPPSERPKCMNAENSEITEEHVTHDSFDTSPPSLAPPLPSTAAHTTPHLPDHPIEDKQDTSIRTTDSKLPSARTTRLQTSLNNLELKIAETQHKLNTASLELRMYLDSSTTKTEPNNDDDDENNDNDDDNHENESTLKQAHVIVAKRITLLRKYNEMKDIGMGLIGLLAEHQGKTIGEVMAEKGVSEED